MVYPKQQNTLKNFALFLLLLLAIIIRIPGLNTPLWGDEFISLRIANEENFVQALGTTVHPFLYFLLLKMWQTISGNVIFLRSLAVIFGVATAYIMFLWIKKYAWQAGYLAGLMSATVPLAVQKSQEVRHYSLLFFTTALSYYFADRYAEDPKKASNIVGLIVSMSLVVCSHFIGAFVLLSLFVFLLFKQKNSWKHFWETIRLFILPGIIFIGNIAISMAGRWVTQGAMQTYWIPKPDFGYWLSVIVTISGLTDIVSWALNTHILLAIIVFIALLILLTNLIRFGNWKKSLPFILAAFSFWAAAGIYSLVQTPVYYPRQVLPGILPLIGFTAIQITSITPKNIRKLSYGIVVILVFFSIASLPIKNRYSTRNDWNIITSIVKDAYQPSDTIILLPGYLKEKFDYYYPGMLDENWISILPTIEEPIHTFSQDFQQKLDAGYTTYYLVEFLEYDLYSNLEIHDQLLSMLNSQSCDYEDLYFDGTALVRKYQITNCTP